MVSTRHGFLSSISLAQAMIGMPKETNCVRTRTGGTGANGRKYPAPVTRQLHELRTETGLP